MANNARIIGNIAVDVSADPAAHFHPDIAGEFSLVPDEVQVGWRLVDDIWTPPDAAPEMTITFPKVSPVEFKLLFTSSERAAITAARSTDVIVNDFFGIIDDPRLTVVDLGLHSTQSGLSYLVALGLLTESRRDEILLGTFQ